MKSYVVFGALLVAVLLFATPYTAAAVTEVSSTSTSQAAEQKVTDVAGSGDSITAQRTANNIAFIFAVLTASSALVVLGLLAHKNSNKVTEQSVDESIED